LENDWEYKLLSTQTNLMIRNKTIVIIWWIWLIFITIIIILISIIIKKNKQPTKSPKKKHK
jgi:uncharacterized membrane protein